MNKLDHISHDADYAIDGESVIGIVSALIQLILALVPHEQAQAMLTAEDVRRGKLMADLAELAKFGPQAPPAPDGTPAS